MRTIAGLLEQGREAADVMALLSEQTAADEQPSGVVRRMAPAPMCLPALGTDPLEIG